MTVKFGTDGWRAVISETFTFSNLRLVAQAIADFVCEENSSNPGVVIGFDTRFLSDRYAAEVARVMAANQIQTWLARADTPDDLAALRRAVGADTGRAPATARALAEL